MLLSNASAPDVQWAWALFSLMTIPALVVLNGFFVAAEFSLVAVRRTRVETLVASHVAGADALDFAVNHIDRCIAATQLGITLASIGLGWTGEPALVWMLEPLFRDWVGFWGQVAVHSVATGVAFVLITFMHVVFGELVPKSLALQRTERIAIVLSPILLWFTWVTRPMTVLMNLTGNFILARLGCRASAGAESVHSISELSLLVEDSEEAGLLDPDQAEFVQNVFRLSDKRVRDCMVPRDKMAALELSLPPERVLEAVRSGAHTRMPVYHETLDNIVGIVNTKNLFFLYSVKGLVILEDALYPALFLKPDESVANALRLFRKAHRPMALVRDEEGVIRGLLTLEDILEEIIGDIEDEHDLPTPKLQLRGRRPGAAQPKPGGKPPAGGAKPPARK